MLVIVEKKKKSYSPDSVTTYIELFEKKKVDINTIEECLEYLMIYMKRKIKSLIFDDSNFVNFRYHNVNQITT